VQGEKEGSVKVTTRCAAVAAALLVLASCAGTTYVRTWTYENSDMTDVLSISGENFRLERTSPAGATVFSGKVSERGAELAFEIESWRPANAPERRFDPPLVYLYKARKFSNGIAFYSYHIEGGKSPLNIFIRAPIDFDVRD